MNLISLQGERWDELCVRAYGNVTQQTMNALRAANAEAARQSVGFTLPAGLTIIAPDMPLRATTGVEIAPWQR